MKIKRIKNDLTLLELKTGNNFGMLQVLNRFLSSCPTVTPTNMFKKDSENHFIHGRNVFQIITQFLL